jgi:hypothetical protein
MKTALAFLLGLTIGVCVHDPATVLRIALGASGGAAASVLWWRRHGESERDAKAREQDARLYHEALVAHGFRAAMGNPAADLLTTQRTALPPVPPKVTP